MPVFVVETQIKAPPAVCFDLVRKAASDDDKNKQITDGEFALGQTVTFISSFLGFRQTLAVKVAEFKRPHHFTDEMTRGVFKSFKHIHEFTEAGGGTLMKDTFIWTSPFGIFGKIADRLFLENLFRKLVKRRNARLKQIAETVQN